MKRFNLLLLTLLALPAFARTGSVHDDFIIWLAPSVFLILLWSGYKLKQLWLRRNHKPNTHTDNS